MRARGTRPSLVLWLLAVCASPVLAQSEGMPWRTDFQAARAEAQQSGKLLLVHFWTETCGPCKLLEARVFSQPQVAIAVANEYIPVKVNANESPEIAQAYGVTRVPTDVIVTHQGQLVHSFVSPATPMEYVALTTQVSNAYHTKMGGAYATAAAAAPAPSATMGGPTTTPTIPQQQTPSPAGAFAAYGAATQQQPASQPVNNAFAAQQPTTPPQTPPQQPAPQQQMNPAAMVAQAPSQAQPQPPVQPQATQPQATQPPAVASAAPQLPPGVPPLGFEGYCPVTMKNEWRWAKGDVRWGAIDKGRTYLFASEEAQKAFLANPEAYSPVLSGCDPVAAVDKQQSVAGVREFAVEFEGRFYMFANEQSLEKFWSNPTAYAQGAQRVAALPAGGSFIR